MASQTDEMASRVAVSLQAIVWRPLLHSIKNACFWWKLHRPQTRTM